jgi:pyrophosphatase PpaX
MIRYRAILFDLDGTLLDSVSIILKATKQVFADMQLPYDEATVRKSIGIPLVVQAVEWAGDRAEEFRERYRPIYSSLQEEHARLFPNTHEMLQTVRREGLLTGVVTSKGARGTRRALDKTGISSFFDTVVTADDVVFHKPHPDPIIKALTDLSLEPHEALYVGDSLFDAEAAQAAGVDMAGVSWGVVGREELLPKCSAGVFDTWDELLRDLIFCKFDS